MNTGQFITIVNNFYANNRRSFAWRETITPYNVFVSEVMLQQTQTYRVAPKFDAFIQYLPDFKTLADAPFSQVLSLWKGLGYNRRALNLQRAAQMVVDNYNNILPDDPRLVDELPGIGPATASSIVCFAFNKPTVFIETNIRTVFIYHFFPCRTDVHDKELIPLIQDTVDQINPREWYYALMDYGVYLKKEVGNVSRASKHYTKQSRFEGSNRQIRGAILECLLQHGPQLQESIHHCLSFDAERIDHALEQLLSEKIVHRTAQHITL